MSTFAAEFYVPQIRTVNHNQDRFYITPRSAAVDATGGGDIVATHIAMVASISRQIERDENGR